MSKIAIVLEGGLVQEVHSDDPNVEVAVLDHDVFEDFDPKLDLDSFFSPEFDPELVVLEAWQEKKSQFLIEHPQIEED